MSHRRDIYGSADLSRAEQEHVRTALVYLRAVYDGSWEILGKQLHFDAATLIHVVAERRTVSPTMTFRVARLAKVGIDDLLAGKFPPAGTCVNCGCDSKARTP